MFEILSGVHIKYDTSSYSSSVFPDSGKSEMASESALYVQPPKAPPKPKARPNCAGVHAAACAGIDRA
eukprot:CAMPEP_0184309858 /NCGR_PEP_ID=MMETSP1049-20130417/20184_1 /TAXON_ID=77928 /ORGANISM="Proteomonas sulcata, Strain CCMP704" /LENGTH=67 /DNA_ID=CAMNT_0026622967 /DNA_START=27 /DNA_END=230 /DNA_ORIENTATION=+